MTSDHVRTQVVRWSPPQPFGDLGRATCRRLGPNLWMAQGPVDEVGLILEDAWRFGLVEGDPAQPMGGGMVLVNFRVVPRRPRAAAPAESFSPRAAGSQRHAPATVARPAAEAAEQRVLPAAPADRSRPLVPRWAWITAAVMVPVGGVVGGVWWLWLHLDAIFAGVSSAALAALGFLALIALGRALLGSGGTSGTWKTN